MILSKCYCGRIQVEIPRKPRLLTDCNCSLCRKYGALWAYFKKNAITIRPQHEASFIRSVKHGGSLRVFACKKCGCVTHYDWGRRQRPDKVMAVNARIFDLDFLETIPVKKLDGARQWRWKRESAAYPFAEKRRAR
jgi:hypothetical protein